MPIEWNDKYCVCHKAIDEQHKELFRLGALFLAAKEKESQKASSKAFHQYTKDHFWHEENIMHEVKYPFTATHLRQHRDLLEKLSAIDLKIDANALYGDDFELFINHWLLEHFAKIDSQLAVYVKRSLQGA
jgi:hemerythrin-like metal-binding protein